MTLFGFLGPFPDSAAFESLVARGPKPVAGAQGRTWRSADGLSHTCTGPQVAGDESLSLVLKGRPVLADGPWRADGGSSAQALLQAYRMRGPRLLQVLHGSFALAILDGDGNRALLAIDRMGIERLAFAVCGQCLTFSTSAEAVATFPPIDAPVSEQGLFNYLLHHMVPAPNTIFKGVHKLRAGCCAVFERGRLSLERFWQPEFEETQGAPFESLRTELKTSLATAVRACEPGTQSGAFLSGGLDSSSVAGVLSEVGPHPTRTFSIGFGYPQYDELGYARIANARFGCEGHEYTVHGADIAETFPLIAQAYDEPFGNSSALPVYYCAKLARANGVNHLLAGDGGDELFAGNSRYVDQQVFEHYQRVPRVLRRALLEPLVARWPERLAVWPLNKARGYIEKANIPLPIRLEAWNVIYRAGPAEFLHPDILAGIDPQAPLADMQELWNAAPCQSTLNRMLYYDWQYTLADNDLRKVETMCELAGVRVSYPMLHPEVVAMSLRVPPGLKMPSGALRDFYKRAMRGYLPDEIIEKKKHGFGLPFGLWLQESATLRDLIFGNLSSLRARRLMRPEFIDRLLQLHGKDDASYYGVFLWVLAMLEQWLTDHGRRAA